MTVTTRLFAQELVLPAASLGPENPLPPLHSQQELHHVENLDDLPADLQHNIRYGGLASVLPCLDQDGYDRNPVKQALPSLVLENDHLRATVLPGLGGRLYSLVHKATGEELLYRNPVLQPANLALRNAWFAGGVEWNLGSTGHWTGTCAPMHAARIQGPDGSPLLRLWEWERSRGLVTQLDFWLPADSELLYVGARIQNPSSHDVPAYWWSNIAVEQSPGTRVLAPADQAWRFGYGNTLDLIGVPEYDGVDLSYPMRHRRAVDFFFELAPEQRPWIAALDADGNGLVQASTDRLRGRKLFIWGEGKGGRRWQEWLSPGLEGHGYAEIQAGLARTQLEHLRLPAATSWHWLEAYGRLDADPQVVHSEDWNAARAGVDAVLESLLPATELTEREQAWLAIADAEPVETLAVGSGWGALELARTGEQVSRGTPFAEETMTERERAWLPLLAGNLPATSPLTPPGGTLVAWHGLLEAAEDNWLVWYHRGVCRWAADDRVGALEAWWASNQAEQNPWALRNLAIGTNDVESALSSYEQAVELTSPQLGSLFLEAINYSLEQGDWVRAARIHAGADTALRADGRFQLVEVRLRLGQGDAAGAEALLEQGIELAGLREGANQLAELWCLVQQQLGTDRPVPAAYDFSMFGDD
jgi:tetratricopeptide (TPR) repeat protein